MLNDIALGIFIACVLMLTVFRSKFKGDIGEIVVARKLNGLDKEKYIKFHDIKLRNQSTNTKASQIDHLIISIYGIFCVESKAYKGKIYGKEFSKQWTQHLGKQKYNFMNPVLQNYGHIKSVESLLEDKYPNLPYYSIIAFSPEANLKSVEVNNAYICKLSKTADTIRSLSLKEIITKDELEDIRNIIKDNKIFQTEFAHNREIKKIKKESKKKISQNICPKCGGNLIERSGKYGKFIGCSNFPKCRFTVKS